MVATVVVNLVPPTSMTTRLASSLPERGRFIVLCVLVSSRGWRRPQMKIKKLWDVLILGFRFVFSEFMFSRVIGFLVS